MEVDDVGADSVHEILRMRHQHQNTPISATDRKQNITCVSMYIIFVLV